jgi:hydrogenase large subunit
VLLVLGGASTASTYLVAFNPGDNWSYFPSTVPEMFDHHRRRRLRGLAYIYLIKRFPILAGAEKPAPHPTRSETPWPNASRRPDHPHRRPPPHRRRGRRGQGAQLLVLGPDVARHRADPPGARPARRVDLHPAHLRGVHHRPRHRLGAGGRERPRLEIPKNAQYIRNLILAAHALHDHIVHFYHLSALDWVDVVSALRPTRRRPAGSAEPLALARNSARSSRRSRTAQGGFVDSGQLGIFTNGYWGHPAMKLSPEVNLLAVSHYLQALEYQRKANQVVAILGSKTPNIQNLAVGGVANAINLDNQATLNMDQLFHDQDLLEEVDLRRAGLPAGRDRDRRHVPGVAGLRRRRHQLPGGARPAARRRGHPVRPAGRHDHERRPGTLKPFTSFQDPYFRDNVEESIAHSWYDGDWQRHPWEEETVPKYTEFEDDGQVLLGQGAALRGQAHAGGPAGPGAGRLRRRPRADRSAGRPRAGAGSARSPASGWPRGLHSTLGRHAPAPSARGDLRGGLKHWELLVDNIGQGDTEIFNPEFPKGEHRGFGFHEAPRGVLSHWVVIRDGKIVNYQAVVPSTWNAGPRDEKGQIGPLRGLPGRQPGRRPGACRSRCCAPSTPSTPASPAPCHTHDPRGR